MEIKDKIKEIRIQKNISTYKLADIITKNGFKISQSAISKIENGKRKIDTEILKQISKALDTPVSTFLGMSDIENLNNKQYEESIKKVENLIDGDAKVNIINNEEFKIIKNAIENLSYCIIAYFSSKKIFLDQHTVRILQYGINKNVIELITGLENKVNQDKSKYK